MAMKCVAQMPQPLTAASSAIQSIRERARDARARSNRLMATALARKQTAPASATSRQSCSELRQFNTWYMHGPSHFFYWSSNKRMPPFKYVNRGCFLYPMVNNCFECSKNGCECGEFEGHLPRHEPAAIAPMGSTR